MHLVYKALEKHAIPNTLPPELMPQTKRKDSVPLGVAILTRGLDGIKNDIPAAAVPIHQVKPARPPPLPVQPPPVPQVTTWVITSEEKAKSDALFIKSDIDRDGFVSGQEIKDVFLQSGVPNGVLAHIW